MRKHQPLVASTAVIPSQQITPTVSSSPLWVMVVSAPCALLYAGLEGFKLNLYILAKEIEPFENCLSLGHRQDHDARAGKQVLV